MGTAEVVHLHVEFGTSDSKASVARGAYLRTRSGDSRNTRADIVEIVSLEGNEYPVRSGLEYSHQR